MKASWIAPVLVLAVVACSGDPAGLPDEPSMLREVVLTEGTPAPASPERPPLLSVFNDITATLGGSIITTLSVHPQSCGAAQEVVITYTITAAQGGEASFAVNTSWIYNGVSWVGSAPVTVNVPERSGGDPATVRMVTITVDNQSETAAGNSSITVLALNQVGGPNPALNFNNSTIVIPVQFVPCISENTPPTLVVPDKIIAEATSSLGVSVNFVVTATDLEDDDADLIVICDHDSGDTFPLGTTTVSCSVEDSGGLETQGSFKIKVRDTTAPVFTVFPGNQTLIAANISGAVLDLGSLGIEAKDYGPGGANGEVSPPVDIACMIGLDDADGYLIAIGQTVTVACTATDNSEHPSPNTSAPSYFDVEVTLNVACVGGFEPPLRMAYPFSSHKRTSTIPHKFPAPCYEGGIPATDLAGGLNLVLKYLGGGYVSDIDGNDNSAGSTAWRYDDGHYIFNAKSQNNWQEGSWLTTVSYAGVKLAETTIGLKK